jgi:ATP-dependent DNA ligase
MLCEKTDDIFTYINTDEWIAEYKFDGGRAIFDKGKIKGRKAGTDYTDKLPELKSNMNAVLDAELVYLNDDKSRYDNYLTLMSRLRLNKSFDIRIQSKKFPIVCIVFDILELNGKDLRDKPLMERKQILDDLEFDNNNFIKVDYSTEIERVLFTAKERGFEGIILKRLDSTYKEKRSSNWLKYRFVSEADIEVVRFDENPDNSITAETKEGIRVKVSNPYHNEVRKLIQEKGKAKITIEFMDKTDKGKYRFPKFKEYEEKNGIRK